MSKVLGKWIADSAIGSVHLTAGAKQSVLESKLIALRSAVLNFAATGSDDTVTTEVEASATTDTPITALTALGIYTGTVSGANDPKRVLIRAAGTDNGIDDGTGDDVYGVLTEATGTYTLSYKTAVGGTYTFSASTNIDFYFVEVYNEYSKPASSLLLMNLGGVVDATGASALQAHLDDTTGAHAASAISFVTTSLLNIASGSTDVQSAVEDLDAAIGALDATPTNYTPTNAAIVADHLAAIDTALGTAASTEFSDSTFRIIDNAAPTKKIAFEASAITAGNVRTIAMPDRNVDLDWVMKPKTQVFTLSSTNISNKYVDLVSAIVNPGIHTVRLWPVGGPEQAYTTDFTASNGGSGGVGRVTWSGLGLDGVLEENDVITIVYGGNGIEE